MNEIEPQADRRPAPDGAYGFLRETGPITLFDKKNAAHVTIEEEPVCEIGGSCMEFRVQTRKGQYKRKVIVAAHITRDNWILSSLTYGGGVVWHDSTDREIEDAVATAKRFVENSSGQPQRYSTGYQRFPRR